MYQIKLISIEKVGKKTNISVSITNNSEEIWNSGVSGINLAAWWGLSQNKKLAKRHYIFNEFGPGETKNFSFYINDPIFKKHGDQIQVDLVYEDVYWFRDRYNEIELNKELSKLGDQIQVTADDYFKNKYLQICGEDFFKMEKIPEDLFFSLYCYLNGKYKEDNTDFSIELIDGFLYEINLNKLPFGFHKIDKFNQWKEVLNIYINKLNK